MKIIALITDFGYDDNFSGVMKGVIKGIAPDVEVIDITHGVRPFSVIDAQFSLYSSYRYFPAGTVFCIVVDPGVGTDRKILLAVDDSYAYVMPDNGIISAVRSPALKAYSVEKEKFGAVSSTFHGRDIFAPLAAGIAKGIAPDEFGALTERVEARKFPAHTLTKAQVEGVVAHIDRFGNIITTIPNEYITDREGQEFTVEIGDSQCRVLTCRNYQALKHGQIGMLRGSAALVEFALPEASLAGRYSVRLEDRVRIYYNA